ncbi:MAG: type II toxin-antitoxin system Phd/YefM family antitoxin [Propionibacteriaceae bacterium]|jgi:prevent-host-death family protein|nr:type II toxin-antitoxin system Phd/YefM family antitoxin [Propionibacteriaceae bacterium]
MTSIPIAEAKARFSEVIRQVELGNEIIVTRGVGKEEVAAVIPIAKYRTSPGITLGAVSGWGEITIADDWEITDGELLEA